MNHFFYYLLKILISELLCVVGGTNASSFKSKLSIAPTLSPSSYPTLLTTASPSISISPTTSSAPSTVAPTQSPSTSSLLPPVMPTATPTAALLRGIVAMYTFKDGSLTDSSPNTYKKSKLSCPNGCGFYNGVDGTANSAVYLSGNQYMVGYRDDLPSGDKTISLWVKIDMSYGLAGMNPMSSMVYTVHRYVRKASWYKSVSTMMTYAAQSQENKDTSVSAVSSTGMNVLGFGTGCGTGFMIIMNSHHDGTPVEVQSGCETDRVAVSNDKFHLEDIIGVWTHIAVSTSMDSGTSIYINGDLAVHSTIAFVDTNVTGLSGIFALGTVPSPVGSVPYWSTAASYFQGAIDDVMIYGVALSSAELSRIYEGSDSPLVPLLVYVVTGALIGISFIAVVIGLFWRYRQKRAIIETTRFSRVENRKLLPTTYSVLRNIPNTDQYMDVSRSSVNSVVQ